MPQLGVQSKGKYLFKMQEGLGCKIAIGSMKRLEFFRKFRFIKQILNHGY